jgi:hypothetical protein
MNGFVCITKKEKLRVYTENTDRPKDLVFTDEMSYAGYYSETPGKHTKELPNYAFLTLQKSDDCREDDILRAALAIQKEVDFKFSAFFSVLTYLNKYQPAIRIDIEDFLEIPALIEAFNERDIYFLKFKQVQPFNSRIKIKKYLDLKKVGEGVYTEDRPHHYYIQVPKLLEWIDFEDLIISVKATKEFDRFDAALATHFGQGDEINEFFRIYTELFSIEDLEKLRATFLQRIKLM